MLIQHLSIVGQTIVGWAEFAEQLVDAYMVDLAAAETRENRPQCAAAMCV